MLSTDESLEVEGRDVALLQSLGRRRLHAQPRPAALDMSGSIHDPSRRPPMSCVGPSSMALAACFVRPIEHDRLLSDPFLLPAV